MDLGTIRKTLEFFLVHLLLCLGHFKLLIMLLEVLYERDIVIIFDFGFEVQLFSIRYVTVE